MFSSYLENRYQSVNIQGISSKNQPLRFGVPQGSVLGLFLFTQYTVPIGAICQRHGVNYQLYADDTQVYVSLSITIALAKIKAWAISTNQKPAIYRNLYENIGALYC